MKLQMAEAEFAAPDEPTKGTGPSTVGVFGWMCLGKKKVPGPFLYRKETSKIACTLEGHCSTKDEEERRTSPILTSSDIYIDCECLTRTEH